jgi:O-antigen/teichoic acid export membrane protein
MLATAIRSLTNALAQKISTIILYISSTSSMVVGIATQAIGFVILARFLGKEQFGQLATITAATGLGAAWVQLGCAEAMRRRVGRDVSTYGSVLGHCVTLIFGWGSIVAIVFAAVASTIVHIEAESLFNFAILLMFVVCNLIFFPWISLTEQIFLAHGNFTRGNLVNAGLGVLRALAAVVACLGFGVHSLSHWAMWNVAAFVGGSVICAMAISKYGKARLGILREEIPIGITFGISGFLGALRGNVDILVLTAVTPLATVGAYGLAKRIISIAVVTGASLDRLLYTRLAVAGQGGASETFKLARRYVVYAVVLTGATSIALFVASSSVLPFVFGNHFGESIDILRTLCWVLILYGVQNIAFDALNAANLHRLQVAISTGAVLIGSAAVTALTLKQGLAGTYVGIYISEVIGTIALWSGLTLAASWRRNAKPPPVPPS